MPVTRAAIGLVLAALATAPAAAAGRAHVGYPSSIVALGNSGSTGDDG